jgi:hypothetical protein
LSFIITVFFLQGSTNSPLFNFVEQEKKLAGRLAGGLFWQADWRVVVSGQAVNLFDVPRSCGLL